MNTRSDAVALPEFGMRLREHRELKGLSQRELAELARTEQRLISRIECGRSLPSLPLFSRLAVALEASADSLLGTWL